MEMSSKYYILALDLEDHGTRIKCKAIIIADSDGEALNAADALINRVRSQQPASLYSASLQSLTTTWELQIEDAKNANTIH